MRLGGNGGGGRKTKPDRIPLFHCERAALEETGGRAREDKERTKIERGEERTTNQR